MIDRRTFLLLGGSALSSGLLLTPSVDGALAATRRTRRRAALGRAAGGDVLRATWTDAAGTRSTYHLFVSGLTVPAPRGLVVYLDGDGMYGHDHPRDTWALGGSRGVVAQAAARGYATLSIRTPSPDATFWTRGAVNAAYVAALTRTIKARLRVDDVWFVGYSGGSQLITKFLLPRFGSGLTSGGAVITGGGGAPRGRATLTVGRDIPLVWYTGSLDDGRNTDDGYDALDDAKRGSEWYRARGARVTRLEPRGLDHEDLGGRFGTVLATQLDRYRPTR